MATIKEDYVSFETAKLLKEKGFQQLQNNCGYFTTEMVYSIDTDDNGEHHFAHQYPAGVYSKDKYIAAPTHQMSMKWLREFHDITISIFPTIETDMVVREDYNYAIYKNKTSVYQSCSTSYEQAVEAALKYSLENLIK